MSESADQSTTWYWNQKLGRPTNQPPLGKRRLIELAALYRRGLLHSQHTLHPSVVGFVPHDK